MKGFWSEAAAHPTGVPAKQSDMISHLTPLFEHMAWADARVLASLRDAPDSERALTLYSHVLGAEHVWLSRMAGQEARLAVWPALTLAEAEDVAEGNAAGYRALLSELGPAELDREVTYRNSAGREFRSRLVDILLHVAMHGAYHRGQVALLVRDGAGEPAATDYIAFARGAPAATTGP
jgi:uncharacterized damage-inducible protein DinB